VVGALGFYWVNDVDRLRSNPPVWRDSIQRVGELACASHIMMSLESIPDGRLIRESKAAIAAARKQHLWVTLDLSWHRLLNDAARHERMLAALPRIVDPDERGTNVYSFSFDEPDPAGADQFRGFTRALKRRFPYVRTQVVYSVPNLHQMVDGMNDFVDDMGFDWYFWWPHADQFAGHYERLEAIATRGQRLWLFPETFVFQAQRAGKEGVKARVAEVLPFYHRWAREHPRVYGVYYFIWNAPAAGEIGLGLQQFLDPSSPDFCPPIADQVRAFGRSVLAASARAAPTVRVGQRTDS
jgi:hypothetical protein